ncbi:MAG: nicotinate-nucleotide adenylyltransferase [Cohaesibacteraceae bacterium]
MNGFPPRYPAQRVRLPAVGVGQSVGLYGGSFDPVHDGHILVAEQGLKAVKLDWIWWLVTPGNPLKAHDPSHGREARMAAVDKVAGNPRAHILDVEQHLGVRYTADTVSILQTMRPDVRFVWLMGADNLAGFHNWNEWKSIVARVPIAVIDRPGSRHAALSSKVAQRFEKQRLDSVDAALLPGAKPPIWSFVRGPLSSSSSTLLRAKRALLS